MRARRSNERRQAAPWPNIRGEQRNETLNETSWEILLYNTFNTAWPRFLHYRTYRTIRPVRFLLFSSFTIEFLCSTWFVQDDHTVRRLSFTCLLELGWCNKIFFYLSRMVLKDQSFFFKDFSRSSTHIYFFLYCVAWKSTVIRDEVLAKALVININKHVHYLLHHQLVWNTNLVYRTSQWKWLNAGKYRYDTHSW